MASLTSAEKKSCTDIVLGDGSEIVYAYYNPRERDFATLQGRKTWPHKIGRTTLSDPWGRVLGQTATDGSFRPRLICLRTDNSVLLERYLLNQSPGVEGALGTEWRVSSQAELEKLFEEHEGEEKKSHATSIRARMSIRAYKELKSRASKKNMHLRAYIDYLLFVTDDTEEAPDLLFRLEALERRVRDLEGAKATEEPVEGLEEPVEGLEGPEGGDEGDDALGDVLDELEGLEL